MAVNRIFWSIQPVQNLEVAAVPRTLAGSVPILPTFSIAVIGGAPLDVAAQQYLYRVAYEQARQALEPPRHDRLLSNWN